MSTLKTNNIQNLTSSFTNIVLNADGSIVLQALPSVPQSFMRNRIINGNMQIAQRATSATMTAGAGYAYSTVDRWFSYCTGANVAVAQIAGAGNNRNVLQFTGAASVTAIGVGQRIESVNCYDLTTQYCTLSVLLSNSLLTTVTWTAYYASTTDTFGTLASPTKTSFATGTFTVNNSPATYTAQMLVPAAAITGIEIVFSVGAQTGGLWQIGNVQLEAGTVATPFERRPHGEMLLLCQRYYEQSTYAFGGNAYAASATFCQWVPYKVTKRIAPTLNLSGTTFTNVSSYTSDNNTVDGYRAVIVPTALGPWAATGSVTTISAEL